MWWLKIWKLKHLENGTNFFYEIKKKFLTFAPNETFLEIIIFSGGKL